MGHSWSRGFDDHEGAALSPTPPFLYSPAVYAAMLVVLA